MSVMCNLSQGIVDDAKAEIILNMFKKGYTLEQIADVTELTGKMVELVGTSIPIGVMENGVSTFDTLA